MLLLKKELCHLNSQGYINKFIWVPAHSNIYGNEQADSLAKLGVRCGSMFNRQISSSEYFTDLKQYSLNNWQLSWDFSDKGRWCHSILPNVSRFSWFKNFAVGRNFICTLSRLISNHYVCNSYLYRININDSNLCDCDVAYEDIDHIVFHCTRFAIPRIAFFRNLKIYHRLLPQSVRDILGSKFLPSLKILNRFLNDALYYV